MCGGIILNFLKNFIQISGGKNEAYEVWRV
jgi:hypothetical protein